MFREKRLDVFEDYRAFRREDWELQKAMDAMKETLELETFVDANRFKGICYRTANWIRVGKTSGRGKRDREHRYALPIKNVFVYPLDKTFRDKHNVQQIRRHGFTEYLLK